MRTAVKRIVRWVCWSVGYSALKLGWNKDPYSRSPGRINEVELLRARHGRYDEVDALEDVSQFFNIPKVYDSNLDICFLKLWMGLSER